MTEHHEIIRTALDAVSIITVIGTLLQVLPAIAALFTIVWTGIRIWETKTVEQWWKKLKGSWNAK